MAKRRFKVNFPDGISIKNIDLDRFNKLPCILNNHKWDKLFIGRAYDIKLSHKGLYITPKFDTRTEDGKIFESLHKRGLINNYEAGGFRNKDYFDLHEISICP